MTANTFLSNDARWIRSPGRTRQCSRSRSRKWSGTSTKEAFLIHTTQTLPIMNIVFGKLVGEFTGYFVPGSTVTESRFKAAVNKNA